MATRRQQTTMKQKEVRLAINICTDRISDENHKDLGDFKHLLRRDFQVVEEPNKPTNTGNIRNIKITLKSAKVFGKAQFFEKLSKAWCSSICSRGDPFWLESAEPAKETFKFKSNDPKQVLLANSFGFGSFFNRGTYIEHWSSQDDQLFIKENHIQIEFEHDAKLLVIIFFEKDETQEFKEVRIEMEYRHLETFVVIDNDSGQTSPQKTVNLYIPLQFPPKVFQEVKLGEYTNYKRVTHFLKCRREVLGSCSVLCLCFPENWQGNKAESPSALIARLSQKSFSCFFGAIKTKPPLRPTETPTTELPEFKIIYALECLLSRGYKVRDRLSQKFYDLLQKASDRYKSIRDGLRPVTSENICNALYRLLSLVETDRFCPLEYHLNSLLYGEQKHLTAFQFEKPNHYVYVPRLVITPTQRFLIPPELVAENRVIRDYGHENAMRIAFRDEDFSKLSSTHREGLNDVLQERVIDLLSKDIEIGGHKFEFLACSNSQLRDHGAWLYAVDGEHRAHDIRCSLGRLDEIRCVATYVSRMGQCFSSTKEAVTIDIEEGFEAEQIPDVEIKFNDVFFKCCQSWRSGTYTFSDGVGKISRALARKVADSLNLDPIPSAYQIRFGGCKGMLAIDSTLPHGNFREILQYRKSMRKFDSSHRVLEICETTKPNLLYLNRQCIILLSGLGVPDDVFIGLQDEMLRTLASILLFESVALESLRRITIPGGMKFASLSRNGINVTLEPFFRSLLLAVYKSRLGDLLRRARIAIPETHGRLLMGVMDETGSLEYGQVFVRYSRYVSEPGKELKTLDGRVVISKNPCFHPGDMRTFEAVDVEALHHLFDCIVFPAKGPRPHSNEMSGSDLDGDKYFVTWFDKLIPTRRNEEPMDFTAPEKKTLMRPVEVSDMIEFVSDYIKNDQLGIIANAHLVHADCNKDGIFSPECIELAHKHSDAVDFPKTGKCPTLSKELRPDQYPDFMMKPGKPQYKSNRILGKLFRKCHSLDRAQRFSSPDTSCAQITPDEDLKVGGYERYLEDAEAARNHYNAKLEGLMSLYGLKNEGEVITGCLFRVNTRLSAKTDEKFEVAQMIQASLATLRAKTREDFYAEFGGEEAVMEEFEEDGSFGDEVMMKASAWYMVTYDQADQLSRSSQRDHVTADAKNEIKLISFPWVVDRILAEIKGMKQEERQSSGIQLQHTLNAVEDLITDQAAYFFESIQSKVANDREMRIEGQRKLRSLISRFLNPASVPRLSLFGESLTGISDHSDGRHRVEIYVHFKWNASIPEQRQHLQYLQRSFKKSGDTNITRHPPILHLQRTQGLLKEEYYITADSNKMLTSAYVGLHVQRCPRLFHLLLIIMHWGRRRRINGYHEKFFLTDEQLAIIFITFCEKSGFINEVDFDDVQKFATSFLGLDSNDQQTEAEVIWNRIVLGESDLGQLRGFRDNVTPGHVLIKFFERYSTTSDDDPLDIRRVTNPVNRNETLCPDLSPEKSAFFSDAALHAFHEIAQCCGLDSLTASSATEDTRELTETMTLPNCIRGALRFAEEYVRVKLSQRTSSQITIRPAPNGYILEATGNYLTLHNVQKELEKVEATCQSYIYDHNVSGGTRFLFLNQRAPEDPVEFKPLKKSDFAVNLKGVYYSTEDKAETKFLNTLSCQLELFQKEHLPYIHGSAILTVRAEFGSIYAENILLTRSTVGVVEDMFSQSADPRNQSGKANKKKMKRHKFMPFSDKAGDWSASFPSRNLISTRESFTLGIKASKNQGLTLVYDENLTFCDVEIPPINWIVADIKTPRPTDARSRDTDMRITVCSERKLEAAEKQDIMTSADYERFKSVIQKSSAGGSDLELAKQQKDMVLFVRHDKTSVYEVQGSSKFWIEEREVKKYDVRGSRFLSNPRASSEVKIYGVFDGKDSQGEFANARKITRDVWEAAKKLQAQINSNVAISSLLKGIQLY